MDSEASSPVSQPSVCSSGLQLLPSLPASLLRVSISRHVATNSHLLLHILNRRSFHWKIIAQQGPNPLGRKCLIILNKAFFAVQTGRLLVCVLSGVSCLESAAGSWWGTDRSHCLLRYLFTDLAATLPFCVAFFFKQTSVPATISFALALILRSLERQMDNLKEVR